jgi:ABC-type Mn2+/Zn2+ transport system ATPase subunit
VSDLLRTHGVGVRFGRRSVLEDVSVAVPAGEIVAVVGPNGAGKTTLFKVALGLVAPSEGTIELAERPAYVPQSDEEELHYPLTALDVTLMGAYRRAAWWRPLGRELRGEALEQLDRVGLRERAGSQIGELSGGQRQRVLLARALLSQRRLLLLDEPLNGVDVTTQDVLAARFEELRVEGRSLLVSTHDLALARRLATRVLLLNRRVVAYGPSAEALSAAALRETFAEALVVVGDGAEVVEVSDTAVHGRRRP